MGLIVSSDNRDVWEPSLAVGYLFVDQIHSLERLVGLESGVSPVVSDEVTIDPARFQSFIKGCLRILETSNNGPLVAMTAGPLLIAIALCHAITGKWPPVPEHLRNLVDDADKVIGSQRNGWEIQRSFVSAEGSLAAFLPRVASNE